MPDDLTLLNVAALLAFGTIWIGYNAVCHSRFQRPNSTSAQMIAVRQAWMSRLLSRDNRTMDATLVGQSIYSATVFVFTTVILLAGLLGMLVLTEQVPSATANLSLRLPGNTQALLEFKLFLLVGILMYAFLKFTSAIHQFILNPAVGFGLGRLGDGDFNRWVRLEGVAATGMSPVVVHGDTCAGPRRGCAAIFVRSSTAPHFGGDL